MKTTLNAIRAHSPCQDGWSKLLRHLGKTAADDEPLSIETILDVNGLDDALWCLLAVAGQKREMQLYAVWCARRIQNLMGDPRSIAALNVAERYARGRATDEELRAAAAEAAEAARAAMEAAAVAWAVADAATRAAAVASAATRAAAAGAGADERTAQADELRRVCREIEAGRDPYPEENGR